jgi:hypothetical protein
VACHQQDYQKSVNPSHVAAGFPTTCEVCHKVSDTSWHQASFDHASVFPLAGVHALQPCASCHVNNVYKGTPRDCYTCHRTVFEKAVNPNHVAAGFPTACETCHKNYDPVWSLGKYAHTTWPLLGSHATVRCVVCHTSTVYRGLPSDCVACHLAAYQQSQSPNHAAAGFPTTCAVCHKVSDTSWHPGVFTHSTYPLVGVHATLTCARCHVGNVYAGTPRDCYTCHRTLYEKTTNPNHLAAGFPTTCDSCHKATDATWLQAVFNHTWFPITSGHHAGLPCASCHPSASSFAIFTCTTCHDRGSTDSHHTGVAGYRYDSAACYACHPRGTHD